MPEPGQNTQAILRTALGELEEREQRLQPFVAELEEVRRGIKTLERALNGSTPSRRQPSNANGSGAKPNPREKFKSRVVDVLRESLDPLPRTEIAKRLEATDGPYLEQVLSGLVATGEVTEMDGGYGVATTSTEEME